MIKNTTLFSYLSYGRFDIGTSRCGLYHLSIDEYLGYYRYSVATLLYDAIIIQTITIGERESGLYGNFKDGINPCGLNCLAGGSSIVSASWMVATMSDTMSHLYQGIGIADYHMYGFYGRTVQCGINMISCNRINISDDVYATNSILVMQFI